MDVVEFFDHIIFSENSFDLLTHDVRIEITNRLLKYMRQQKGADEEKLKGQDDRFDFCLLFFYILFLNILNDLRKFGFVIKLLITKPYHLEGFLVTFHGHATSF